MHLSHTKFIALTRSHNLACNTINYLLSGDQSKGNKKTATLVL